MPALERKLLLGDILKNLSGRVKLTVANDSDQKEYLCVRNHKFVFVKFAKAEVLSIRSRVFFREPLCLDKTPPPPSSMIHIVVYNGSLPYIFDAESK